MNDGLPYPPSKLGDPKKKFEDTFRFSTAISKKWGKPKKLTQDERDSLVRDALKSNLSDGSFRFVIHSLFNPTPHPYPDKVYEWAKEQISSLNLDT